MTKGEFIDAVREKTGLTKKDVQSVYSAIVDVIAEQLKKGDKISLTGFGTFYVSERSPRVGRNPKTGEKIKIKGYKLPAFKTSSVLKDSIN